MQLTVVGGPATDTVETHVASGQNTEFAVSKEREESHASGHVSTQVTDLDCHTYTATVRE